MSDERYLECAIEAARRGGEILKKYWGKLQNVRTKTGKSDLVTEADHESEAVILAYLLEQFPEHSVIGEESGSRTGGDTKHLWAVDPLDGTTNYTHQYPMVCVSIGLIVNDEARIGVIYNPISEELFEGGIGMGVRLNGMDACVSAVEALDESLLVTGFAYDRRTTEDNNYKEFCHLVTCAQGVRRAGSAALDLANCAVGRVDAYWERGLNIWDIAAGTALVREAGGVVTAYDGTPLDLNSGRILASNGLVHGPLSQELQKISVS